MLTYHLEGVPRILATIDGLERALADMAPALLEASDVIYEDARQRFETRGDGGWPPLAESTVQRKTSQGYAEPERPLYAEGNLFESATSPHGPYSFRYVSPHQLVVGVDWAEDGVQIPPVLSYGNEDDGGHIPARQIYEASAELATHLAEVLAVTIKHEAALA